MRLGILMKLDGKPAHSHIIDKINGQVFNFMILSLVFFLKPPPFSFIDSRAKEHVENSFAWGKPIFWKMKRNSALVVLDTIQRRIVRKYFSN